MSISEKQGLRLLFVDLGPFTVICITRGICATNKRNSNLLSWGCFLYILVTMASICFLHPPYAWEKLPLHTSNNRFWKLSQRTLMPTKSNFPVVGITTSIFLHYWLNQHTTGNHVSGCKHAHSFCGWFYGNGEIQRCNGMSYIFCLSLVGLCVTVGLFLVAIMYVFIVHPFNHHLCPPIRCAHHEWVSCNWKSTCCKDVGIASNTTVSWNIHVRAVFKDLPLTTTMAFA